MRIDRTVTAAGLVLVGVALGAAFSFGIRPDPATAQDAADEKPSWETVGDGKTGGLALAAISRLRVPGGWLIASAGLDFLPDPTHAWTDPAVAFEEVPGGVLALPGMKGRLGNLFRAKVPGGWLLVFFAPSVSDVLFYPDAKHAWAI